MTVHLTVKRHRRALTEAYIRELDGPYITQPWRMLVPIALLVVLAWLT